MNKARLNAGKLLILVLLAFSSFAFFPIVSAKVIGYTATLFIAGLYILELLWLTIFLFKSPYFPNILIYIFYLSLISLIVLFYADLNEFLGQGVRKNATEKEVFLNMIKNAMFCLNVFVMPFALIYAIVYINKVKI